jgi:copper transport protein
VSFWQALDPSDLKEVIETRFGRVMLIRAGAWAAFGLIAIAALRRPRPALAAAGAAALALVALTPSLSGHAGTQSPGWALVPADFVHVVSVSVWVGGLAVLVFALPAATGALAVPERTPLLVATLTRFSPIALASVIALAASGTLQTVLELDRLGDLFDTAFGRAVLIKVGLLAILVGLGWANRSRIIPALARLLAERASPGRVGGALRRNLRLEAGLATAAIGVAAALVSYSPSDTAAGGPVSGQTDIGPAVLEYTVDPAAVGSNQVHLYLFNAQDGSQYTAARQVEVQATESEAGIGPLDLKPRRSGPGHYVVQGAQLGIAGDWTVAVTVRTSKFDEDTAELEVPIR